MRARFLTHVLLCLAFASTEVRAEEAEASDEKAVDTPQIAKNNAEGLYQQANDAYNQGNFALAFALYEDAFVAEPNYKLAANLGICALKLRRFREAAEYLSHFLRDSPPNTDEKLRMKANEWLAEAMKHVGLVQVTIADAAAADVFIGSRPVGRVLHAKDTYVDIGTHIVHGHNKMSSGMVEIDVRAGQVKPISLSILPPASIKSKPRSLETNSGFGDGYGAGFGLSAALLVGGVTLRLVEQRGQPNILESENAPPNGVFFARWGLIGAGAAGLVTMTTLFFVTRGQSNSQSITASIRPQIGGATFGVRLDF